MQLALCHHKDHGIRRATEKLGGWWTVLHPTLFDKTEKDGAPGRLWLTEAGKDRSRSLRDDKQKNEQRQQQRLGGCWTVCIPPFSTPPASYPAVRYVRLHLPTHSPAWRQGRAPLARATAPGPPKPDGTVT